jgi:hypothetical protein
MGAESVLTAPVRVAGAADTPKEQIPASMERQRRRVRILTESFMFVSFLG